MMMTGRVSEGSWKLFLFLGLGCLVFLFGATQAWSNNLIYNGDFEIPSSQNPPPGWTMWGPAAYQNPANYTLDMTGPYAGKASLRIHHPAGSSGYVVSSPTYPLQPKKGKIYSVTFFARADRPGRAKFGFAAYESLNPFKDAPSPGSYVLEVQTQWRQFTYEIKEGMDFYADRSRFLLLSFSGAVEAQEERTLWIDRVTVIEKDLPQGMRLVDERSVPYEPLQHRLQAGSSLSVSLDIQKRLRPVNRMVGGISLHRVAGFTGYPYNAQGDYTLTPAMEQAIKDLRLPMTRFYGLGDERFSLEAAIDKAANFCRKVGIPMSQTILEFEQQHAHSKLSPEVWARGVRYAVQKKYPFQYWEIANEPEVPSQSKKKAAFLTPDEYGDHFIKCSQAIRKIQPKAQIGMAISDAPSWGNYLLSKAAGHYDFVTAHYYGFTQVHRQKFEAVALSENYKILGKIAQTNGLLRAYNPGRTVYQLDTEWGKHSSGPNNEAADFTTKNANIYGMLHRAVRLIYYAREGLLRGAGSWNLFSNLEAPGFAILSPQFPEKRTLIYWLYYYFNRHLGESVLDLKGTAPYYIPTSGDDPSIKAGEHSGPLTPVLATLSKDRKHLYLVIANGSWGKEVPFTLNVQNYSITKSEAILLTHQDPNGSPYLGKKEEALSKLPLSMEKQELRGTLPPHSVVFISVQGK